MKDGGFYILRPARPAALVGKALATSSSIAGPGEKYDTFGVIRSAQDNDMAL